MGDHKNTIRLLELLPWPGFCVSGGQILSANHAARQLLLPTEGAVAPLLGNDAPEYDAFSEGTLYLTLRLGERSLPATVRRLDGCDLFTLEDEPEDPALKALALAAIRLCTPLADLTALLHKAGQDRGEVGKRVFQLHRLICNMADANRYAAMTAPRMECLDVCAFLSEQLAKTQTLLESSKITLNWSCPPKPVLTMTEPELLERALNNMLSNALKASPAGGKIDIRLTQNGERLYLSVRDWGTGISEGDLTTAFTRYRRQPGLDPGDGLGLGLPLIRAAATVHGGTVLIQSPEDGGTQITMSLSIHQGDGTQLRSPTFRVDYAGGKDHTLLELSDSLPTEIYGTY